MRAHGTRRMKKGFYTIMSAQFFSSLADNALLVGAIELLKTTGAPSWQTPALIPMFALFYVVLAPLVGAFADAVPKGSVMFYSNSIKVVGCLMMLFGGHPLLGVVASVFVGVLLTQLVSVLRSRLRGPKRSPRLRYMTQIGPISS
jgi:MFS family permease